MEGKTHIIGGLAAGAFYLKSGGSMPQEVLFFASCAVGALIPDICHPNSTIGRKIPLLDNLVNAAFGHRTFTHSFMFLLLSMLLFMVTSWPEAIEMGIWLGMASHLALDAFTKRGIQFFWPFKMKVGFPGGITTGGNVEKGFFSVLIVFIGYCGYQIYF